MRSIYGCTSLSRSPSTAGWYLQVSEAWDEPFVIELPEKVIELAELVELRARLRAEGRKLVQCHGVFDVVHPGHVRYLKFARSLGDVLLVSVTADEAVEKGFDRPLVPQHLRMENLAALELVDLVVLSTESWGGPLLEAVRPDVYVKGREYESLEDPRFAREKSLVESFGGEVVYGSGDVVFSSTEIIQRRGSRLGMTDERVAAYCARHHVTAARLRELLARFADLRVLIVGDPILDRYVFCEGASVAQETPILSVSPVSEMEFPGGGAAIAGQMAALGAQVGFVTTGSADPRFETYEHLLAAPGVELHAVPTEARPLFVKVRYVVDEQKLLKVNHGHHAPISTKAADSLLDFLRREMPGCALRRAGGHRLRLRALRAPLL